MDAYEQAKSMPDGSPRYDAIYNESDFALCGNSDTVSDHFLLESQPHPTPHAPWCVRALLDACACRMLMLMGACDPMLCPIHVLILILLFLFFFCPPAFQVRPDQGSGAGGGGRDRAVRDRRI